MSGQMRQFPTMPVSEARAVRSIFILYFACKTCEKRWYSKPLSSQEANALMVALRMDGRGFRIVSCERCWEQGNESPNVEFVFAEHPVH